MPFPPRRRRPQLIFPKSCDWLTYPGPARVIIRRFFRPLVVFQMDVQPAAAGTAALRLKWDTAKNSGRLDKSPLRVHSQSMRIGVVILFNLLAMAPIAIADETLPVVKAGSEVYSNVTILGVSATDIYFTSNRGLANAKSKDLEPALQKHFNFKPTNAAAIEKKHKA